MNRLPPGAHFTSDIPARMDRLPWSAWHARVVVALGITWMLDGLEVTLVGSVAPVLSEPDTLGLTDAQIGAAATAYLAGAVAGALVFGRLTDAFGRKRLFLVTLSIYAGATFLSAFAWSFASLAVLRALTGAGIGGEYSAVNSAIDELIPARLRGRTDLLVNGTYWLGTAVGAVLTLVLLDPRVLPHVIGWRCVFFVGAVLGCVIMFLRHHVPESPRWLLLHGRVGEAESVTSLIERSVAASRGGRLPPPGPPRELEAKGHVTFGAIARVLFRLYPRRTALGLALMTAQAFAYNGVFFTYPLVLVRFHGVPPGRVGLYLIPFAIGNLLGPAVLGPLFDTVGRRPMIVATYGTSGVLLAAIGVALTQDVFTATTQTVAWCVVFFVASAAASSAYLTVSEIFPVELRGMAIAVFFAVGTGAGGALSPLLFGSLVQSGRPSSVAVGYYIAAALMLAAAAVAAWLGVVAERRSLEEITTDR
ncbi:MAG: MFS transporter [Polyangiaceae bacterium]|nr:MFS transporter [Polyangiaceae bacterium]